MKKEILIISLLLFWYVNLFPQLKLDTLDYTSISKSRSYKLKKILSSNFQKIKVYGTGTTFFDVAPKTEYYPTFAQYHISVKPTDTIMYQEFYIHKGSSGLQGGHQFSIMHINNASNVLILDKVIPNNVKLMFKIYKWTNNEIIIKDITLGMPSRIYYLETQ